MIRARVALAIVAAAAAGSAPALGQPMTSDEAARFTLKPRPGFALLRPRTPTGRRLYRLRAIPVDDRAHDIGMVIGRHRQRVMAGRTAGAADASSFAFNPRSRLIVLNVEDRLLVGEQGWARIGFSGMKLSNRGATATATGTDDRLRVRDWFQPHATIGVQAGPDLSFRLGYADRSRGFGETGRIGPMAGSREAFRAFARTLRAEKRSHIRIDADWQVAAGLDLSLRALDGRIAHRLLFDGGSDRPVDAGSARVRGIEMAIAHQLSPDLRWAMRYGQTQVTGRQERQAALEGEWRQGPWQAIVRASVGSAPALRLAQDPARRSERVEAEIRYRLTGPTRTPVALSLRLTDPDMLAGTMLLRDDSVGIARAADQARGVMLGMAMEW